MRLAHLGHACVLVESASTRLLVDPGTLSTGFEDIGDLDGVLVTHAHADHLDVARLPALLAANPRAELVVDPGSVAVLAELGLSPRVVRAGDRLQVGGMAVHAVGGEHAVVHAEVPTVPNCGYVLDDGAFYHPGDSVTVPAADIDVLGAPVSGPWIKLGEAVDFARSVGARVSVPIHEGALADTTLAYSVLTRLVGSVQVLRRGEPTAV